ncbi:MAG: DNA primase [Ignavibacteriae bacterium]|nr:DNA primase [Ignavibacteriota bacterium]
MIIPQEKLDEIVQASDIVDVISSYTQVKRRGKAFLALCPFHPDKNPSLNISQQKQVYHCFACGASGNVFTFVMDYDKITFVEAATKLAFRAGIELNIRSTAPDVSSEISRLFEINKSAARFFYDKLQNVSGYEKDFITDYIKKRELKKDILKKFGVGYAEKGWDSLLNHFNEENIFSEEDIEKAGLIIKNEKGKYYDRFRGRLIFPIFSENDKVVGFGGRKLYEDETGGKYINSPETRIYNKSRILYGLNFARESIRANDYVLLVEGYMDLISLHQAEIQNVVASSGTALTVEQVQLISRYTKNVVMVYDADLAGIKATRRGIELLLEAGLDLTVVTLPEGSDPDSIIREKGKDEFEIHLNNRKSIIEFISRLYEKENKLSSVQDKTEFVKEIIGYISRMPDKIKRAFNIKDIASKYGLYESDLRDELEKAVKVFKKEYFVKSSVVLPEKKVFKKQEKKKIEQAEIDLLDILVNGDNKAIEYIENNLDIQFLQDETILKITTALLDEYMNEEKIDVSKIINGMEDVQAKALLGSVSTSKYEVSKSEKFANNNTLLSKTERKNTDYLKFAKDVIKRFEITLRQRKIEGLMKVGSNPNEIIRLKREINDIQKK